MGCATNFSSKLGNQVVRRDRIIQLAINFIHVLVSGSIGRDVLVGDKLRRKQILLTWSFIF